MTKWQLVGLMLFAMGVVLTMQMTIIPGHQIPLAVLAGALVGSGTMILISEIYGDD